MTTYKVQPGDTLNTISRKMGVPTTSITGYKSQDPNLIMPGEELSIANLPSVESPAVSTPPANFQSITGEQTYVPPTQTTQPQVSLLDRIKQEGVNFQGILPQQNTTPQITPPAGQTTLPVTPTTPPILPTATETATTPTVSPTQTKVLRTFNLPSGEQMQLEVTPETDALLGGETTRNEPIKSDTADKQVSNFFGQYGIDSGKLSSGFTANPVQTLTTLTDHVMKSMQIPDAITNISNITKQIEALSNERDDEISKIQDNPWKSAGSKQELIAKIQDKYEQRIANRTNSLTLLQNAYQEARQQAQFAVTTAVGLYDKQRTFDQNAIEEAFNREEARAKTAFDTQKFEEDKRQFGLNYALKQQELKEKQKENLPTKQIDTSLPSNSKEYLNQLFTSNVGGKKPTQVETLRPIQKTLAVSNQLSELATLIKGTKTGPILGTLRSMNPYDYDSRAIQATLQATVPNLARGVYGEVGVLTDQDVKNYIQTLPNIKGTKAQNDFVLGMTLRSLQNGLLGQLEVLQGAGYDISGFRNSYDKLVNQANKIEAELGIGTSENKEKPTSAQTFKSSSGKTYNLPF